MNNYVQNELRGCEKGFKTVEKLFEMLFDFEIGKHKYANLLNVEAVIRDNKEKGRNITEEDVEKMRADAIEKVDMAIEQCYEEARKLDKEEVIEIADFYKNSILVNYECWEICIIHESLDRLIEKL